MSDPKRFIPSREALPRLALVAVPVLAGLWVLVAVVRAGVEWFEVRALMRTYTELTGVQPDSSAGLAGQREDMVKRIASHRLIAPPQNMQLTGVLGDQAIFNGSMVVKAGQPAGDMRVVSIGPNWVKVTKDGREQQLWVFQSTLVPTRAETANASGPNASPQDAPATGNDDGGRRSGPPAEPKPARR